MIEPHGGRLVDRVVSNDAREELNLQGSLVLTRNKYQDLVNIATGRFSPLTGFMGRSNFLKVVQDMTLEDGTRWPLPVILDVDAETASRLSPSDAVELQYPEGEPVGSIDVSEVYKFNKAETVSAIFDTDDPSHPGVSEYLNRGDFLVGGDVSLFGERRYNNFDLLPAESRVLFRQRDWDNVVGFQTRNAPHRAHEYLQKTSLEHADGLLIQPKLGAKKNGDYRDEVIMAAYETLLSEYYPDARAALSVFPSKMRYAGPREAVFDAIVRKNQGCTHFVIGRDHAGVEDYYGSYDAHQIFEKINDIRIEPVFYDYSFYCESCDGMASEHVCPHSDNKHVSPSGSKIRSLLQSNQSPSEKMMRPEVVDTIMSYDDIFVTENMGDV